MSVVSPQVQAYLNQLFAASGEETIPGDWIKLYSITADKLVTGVFGDAADVAANTAGVASNDADILALQNLLGTDAVLSDASFTVGAGGTQVLPNTPVVGRRLDVFIDGALLREGGGADYTISGATITFVGAHTAVVLVVKYVY